MTAFLKVARFLNASRAPGPSGVFISSVHFPRFTVWRWPGWPANENDERGRRRDLDAHYAAMARGQVSGSDGTVRR